MGDKINIMDNHSKKIKISFSVIILLFIASITGGNFAVKNNDFFTGKQVSQTINYLNYRLYFVQANNKNLTASIISIFDDANSIIYNSNNAKSIPVLLYHGIIDEPDGSNILLENFKDQMFALKKEGWQTISIEDFYGFMKGEKELPDKSFLLTFDDGRKDSYYPVDPILKALDYKAVMFVIISRSIGDDKEISPFHLSSKELKKMSKSGRWDLQSHGKDDHDFYKIDVEENEGHFLSNKLWFEDKQRLETEKEFRQRINNDLTNSKNDLEEIFETMVISFAYPFGDFGQNSLNFPEAKYVILDTIKSIYPMSFYQAWNSNNPKTNFPQLDVEHLFIKRINVEPQWDAENLLTILESSTEGQENPYDLLTVLENSKEKIMPYMDNFIKNKGWKKTWGVVDFRDESMIIGAHSSTTGSMVFLDGTYLWQNYIFKADVHFKKGQTYSIVAGYKDDSNYVFCSFTSSSVRLEQMIEGERDVLNEFKGKFDLSEKEKRIGIGFSGKDASCYLDDKRVVDTSDVDEKLNKGGIGFKTWDPQVNNSEMIIREVSVEEIK